MLVKNRYVCAALATLLAGAGCSASGGPTPALPPQAAQPASRVAAALHGRTGSSSVNFVFKVPLNSPFKSVQATIYDAAHTHQLAQSQEDLAPGGLVCSSVSGGTYSCDLNVTVSAGPRTIDVAGYPGTGATGTKTPLLIKFPSTVPAGNSDGLNVTLAGAQKSVAIRLVGSGIFATGDQTKGFQFGGNGANAARYLQVFAVDASSYMVAYPRPTLSLASSDTAHAKVVAVPGTLGQLYTIVPLAQTKGPIALTASATPPGGQPITFKANATMQPVLYVIDCWNTTVEGYAPWSTTPIISYGYTTGIDYNSAMALDAKGNLYLANHVSGYSVKVAAISVFAPGRLVASRTIPETSATLPQYLAVDAAGNIFVNENNQDVKEFTLAGGATASRTLSTSTSPTGIDGPYGLAVDKSGNLYVANSGGSIGVSVYAPGTSTTPSATFNAGMNQPLWPAFDTAGNLYVANTGGTNVTQYKPPFTASSTPAKTFGSSASISGPAAISVDPFGNVYVVNGGTSSVVEFSPAGSVVRTITGLGLSGTNLVATDAIGQAYVPNENNGQSVGVYAPGSSTTPALTYSTSMSGPMDVVVWP